MISVRKMVLALKPGEECYVRQSSKGTVHHLSSHLSRAGYKGTTTKCQAIIDDSIVTFFRVRRLK